MKKIDISDNSIEIIKGGCGTVLLLSDEIAVKIPTNEFEIPNTLEEEFEVQNNIWQNRNYFEIKKPVPEPFGFEDIYLNGNFHGVSGIAMERIHGYDLGRCNFLKRYFHMRNALRLKGDIEEKLGLELVTYEKLEPRNAMWDSREGVVRLIDFGHWVYK